MNKCITLLLGITILTSCAHVVSEESRSATDTSVDLSLLFKNPLDYKGAFVVLGGNVVRAVNEQDGTYVEVVEKPLDYRGRPKDTDLSLGRFLIFHEGYLETAVFSKAKNVTVAGEVMGSMVSQLGEMDYPYLLIKSKEIHALKPGEGFPISIGIGVIQSF